MDDAGEEAVELGRGEVEEVSFEEGLHLGGPAVQTVGCAESAGQLVEQFERVDVLEVDARR